MNQTTSTTFSCPYCMAPNNLEIDPDNDINQQQIADCQICCSPIEITIVGGEDDNFQVIAQTDSE